VGPGHVTRKRSVCLGRGGPGSWAETCQHVPRSLLSGARTPAGYDDAESAEHDVSGRTRYGARGTGRPFSSVNKSTSGRCFGVI
jgi:hypothetical protein